MRTLLLTIIFIFSSGISMAAETHWGVAKNDKGDVVYTEKHIVTKKNGKYATSETIYYDPTKTEVIATMKSDYSRDALMPTYEFVDKKSGYKEGLRFQDGKYVIYNQEKGGKEEASVLKKKESLFSCQGWHYYLVENLSLLQKQDIALNLILPSELDFYEFKIKGAESTNTKVVANLELSNWLLRAFAPSLRLVYDKKLKRLVEYEGISNIPDNEGERQNVKIVYQYD